MPGCRAQADSGRPENSTATTVASQRSGRDPGRPAAVRSERHDQRMIRAAGLRVLRAPITALTHRMSALLMTEATRSLSTTESRRRPAAWLRGSDTIKDRGRTRRHAPDDVRQVMVRRPSRATMTTVEAGKRMYRCYCSGACRAHLHSGHGLEDRQAQSTMLSSL